MAHGVERVDEITRLIDEALSGYETQVAGDVWYDDDDARWAEFWETPAQDLLPLEAVQAAVQAVLDAIPLVLAQIAETIAKGVWGLVEFAVEHRAALNAGLYGKTSNNWTDRAVYTWVQAKGKQR